MLTPRESHLGVTVAALEAESGSFVDPDFCLGTVAFEADSSNWFFVIHLDLVLYQSFAASEMISGHPVVVDRLVVVAVASFDFVDAVVVVAVDFCFGFAGLYRLPEEHQFRNHPPGYSSPDNAAGVVVLELTPFEKTLVQLLAV